MSAGELHSGARRKTFLLPDFIQLFMLLIQAIYLLLFFSNFAGFMNIAFRNFEAALLLMGFTTLVSLVAYCIGFSRHTAHDRILLALLLLFHFGIAYGSFYYTVAGLISRC